MAEAYRQTPYTFNAALAALRARSCAVASVERASVKEQDWEEKAKPTISDAFHDIPDKKVSQPYGR